MLRLAAKRVDLAREVGRLKAARGLPIQDFTLERRVLDHARATCERLGLPPDLGEEVMRPLIRGAIRVQETDRIAAANAQGARALLVGGAGAMGRWFVRFLSSQGYRVAVADPRGPVPGTEAVRDVGAEAARPDTALVVVSVPPSACAAVLDELGRARTKALVLDVASLKAPLADALRRLAASGVRVASVHPMFGPTTDLLTGKHVVVCDVGSAAAAEEAKALFRDTSVTVVEMDVETHDRLMAFVLGLAHASTLVFNRVLAGGGVALADLLRTSSTSFDRQLGISRLLAYENVDLYYEIQTLNAHAAPVLALLAGAARDLEAVVRRRDKAAFERWMAEARNLFEGMALLDARRSPVAGVG